MCWPQHRRQPYYTFELELKREGGFRPVTRIYVFHINAIFCILNQHKNRTHRTSVIIIKSSALSTYLTRLLYTILCINTPAASTCGSAPLPAPTPTHGRQSPSTHMPLCFVCSIKHARERAAARAHAFSPATSCIFYRGCTCVERLHYDRYLKCMCIIGALRDAVTQQRP